MPVAIEVRGVHKTFRIPHERHTTLTERLLHLFRQVDYERFEALRGVDLTIPHGAFIGIIGRNGSGKSTLLKLIAGLLPPDQGEIHVDGRMSALLELGLGFSPELTVRENVELYAAVLGYPRREIGARIEDAIHFAELERFRDAKLKNLSTGMRARLGFATALQAESDVLLLDEILAVGDEGFQRKCFDVFRDLKRRRKTIVLVTHDLHTVENLCDYAFFIDSGRIGAEGPPEQVVAAYLQSVAQPVPAPIEEAATATGDDSPAAPTGVFGVPGGHEDTAQIHFVDGWLEDDAGNRVRHVCPGDRLVMVVRAVVRAELEEPIFGLIVNERNGPVIYVTSSWFLGASTGRLSGGQTVEVRLPFDAALQEGTYIANMVASSADKVTLYGKTGDFLDFAVSGRVARRSTAELQNGFCCRVMDDPEAVAGWDNGERRVERGGVR